MTRLQDYSSVLVNQMYLGLLCGTDSSRQEQPMYVVLNAYPPKQDDCMQTASWGCALAYTSSSAVMGSCWEDAVGIRRVQGLYLPEWSTVAVSETSRLTAHLLIQVHPNMYINI